MPNYDRDAENPNDQQPESLELNKETLEDLDLDPKEADQVKGGRAKLTTIVCPPTARQE